MKLKNMILVLLLLQIGTLGYAQSTKEVPLKKQHGKNQLTVNEANGIKVIFKVDTTQKKSEKGLVFSIKFKNDSAAAIEIKNPLDFLSVSLTGENGRNVFVPETSSVLINTKDNGRPAVRSYLIEKVMKGNKEVKEVVTDAATIILPPKAVYEIVFNVTRVLKPDAVKPYTEDQKIKIGSGRYKLFISLAISQANGSGNALNNSVNGTYYMPQTMVSYGK